jgi:hypothetical protein
MYDTVFEGVAYIHMASPAHGLRITIRTWGTARQFSIHVTKTFPGLAGWYR